MTASGRFLEAMLCVAVTLLFAGCAANQLCYTAAREHWKMPPGQAAVYCYVPPWVAK